MKKTITALICVKNSITWGIISICCLIALGVLVKLAIASISAGEKIFWPGVGILALAVIALLIFGITRVMKYIRLMKNLKSAN